MEEQSDPQSVICSKCSKVLYQGQELIPIDKIIKSYNGKCPNCGKSKKEIEDALKHGVPPSHEEIIRRAKEAGLPLKIK